MGKRDRPKITLAEARTGAGTQATIRMEGDLDATAIAAFRDAAFGAIGARPDRLILDLSDVPFVDTAALSGLITVARVASQLRIAIAVRPAAQLRRVFRITGLTLILPIDETEDKERT